MKRPRTTFRNTSHRAHALFQLLGIRCLLTITLLWLTPWPQGILAAPPTQVQDSIPSNPAAIPILAPFKPAKKDSFPLGYANTPFLEKAEAQPIDWRPWSDAVLKEARRSGRPIFLSIGASWCHWCHEMGRDAFENEELAKIINTRFIPVVVDRDLYPEVDRRYQRVVSTLTGRAGWPLTAVLTPSGDVIWGGGYSAAIDYDGRPGLISILSHLAESYEKDSADFNKRARLNTERALATEAQIGRPRPPTPPTVLGENHTESDNISPAQGDFTPDPWANATALDHLVGGMLASWDPNSPGFAQAPRFPHGQTLTLLLTYGSVLDQSEPIDRALSSLDALARSALRDPLTGLFFRYALDKNFEKPGYEVLLTTNTDLLEAYLYAYQLTRRRSYRDTAEGIIHGLLQEMALPEGGFMTSLGDDAPEQSKGGYFTVQPESLRSLLEEDEFRALSFRYGFESPSPFGEGEPFPLREKRSMPEVARRLNVPLYQAERLVYRGEEALKTQRHLAGLPIQDHTFQVAWNAQLATVLFEAEVILGGESAGVAARETLHRITANMDPETSRVPLVLLPEGSAGSDLASSRLLTAECLLTAHKFTGEAHYLAKAQHIVDGTLDTFWDEKSGGFYDVPYQPATRRGNDLMTSRFKVLLDGVQPSTNGVGLEVLLALSQSTGDPKYQALAHQGLSAFEPLATQLGPLGGSFGEALIDAVVPPPVVIVGTNSPDNRRAFKQAVDETFRPGAITLYLSIEDALALPGYNLEPPASAHPLPINEPIPQVNQGIAWVCGAYGCSAPILTPRSLKTAIGDYGRLPAPILMPTTPHSNDIP